MQIKEKVFLVTGAGSGLGAATARALVDAGARVVLADLNREAGEKQAQDLGGNPVLSKPCGERASASCVQTLLRNSLLAGSGYCAGVAPRKVVVRKDPSTRKLC